MTSRLPTESTTDTCRFTLDLPHSDTDTLATLIPQLLAFTAQLSPSYLWHNHRSLHLQLSPLSYSQPLTATQHRHLEGTVDVTDAVDDEWLAVWLLREISRKWTQTVISIDDDDGEFLLIEAADELPTWVTPQNAANRVWIHNGRLHLVPLSHRSDLPFSSSSSSADPSSSTLNPSFDPDEEGFIDRAQAIELVRDDKVDTLAPREVEEAVWARIDGYPAKMDEHHHRTLAYLPTDIALALEDSPELVTEAVKAFYEREPGTLRACNTMTRFPPSPPSSAFSPSPSSSASDLPPTVLAPVRLTRPLYSQLVLQRFYAPKPFEKAGWGVKGEEGQGTGEEDGRRRSVGMKLACGFEMLYARTRPQIHPSSTSSASSTDEVDPTSAPYRAFLASLTEKGFFGGEVEGSERWRVLEGAAREGWVKAKGERPTLSFAHRLDAAVARSRLRPSPLSQRITSPTSLAGLDAPALAQQGWEDSEGWMALDEQGLEEILREREGGGLGESDLEDDDEDAEEEGEGMQGVEGAARTRPEREEERKARKVARRLEEMAGKVEQFVEGRGAVQGALFEDEQTDDEPSEDDDEEMAPPPQLSAEERAERMDKLVAALPADEWGQQTSSAAPPPLAPAADSADADAAAAPVERIPRPPKLTEEKYDGATDSEGSSDDEAMPEGEEGLGGSDVEGEDGPALVGGGADGDGDELDLGEEMDEFLKFATETLGLSEEQYEGILGERRKRGAFVPGPPQPKKTNILPSTSSSSSAPKPAQPAPPTPAQQAAAGNPPPRTQPALRNPNLADFDSLMEQMEQELKKAKGPASGSGSGQGTKPASSSSASTATAKAAPSLPKPNAKPGTSAKQSFPASNRVVVSSLSDDSDSDGDVGANDDFAAMDAELASLFRSAGAGGDGEDGEAGEGGMDLNLVKNFLESFQAQGGFTSGGPAGNLAGRMGFQMPRDA
ncbi:hypothetical protein JCM10207_008160 [Rhodosporidiobolus poonsookiae]